jgi:peptide/nickel transport system permease protein
MATALPVTEDERHSIATGVVGAEAVTHEVEQVSQYDLTREVGYYQLVWRRLLKHRVAVVAFSVLAFIAFMCFIGVHFLPYTDAPDLTNRLSPPGWPHILGTDDLGRDILLRILEGGQVSITVGIMATLVTLLIGGSIGTLSGYFGGWIDNMLMRFTDAMIVIPGLFLVIVIAAGFGHTPATIVLALGVTLWTGNARIIRSVVLSTREKEYVEAARAVGSSTLKVITRHILPNVLGPIVVAATLTIGAAILAESALSFLNLGIGPPFATWGNMLTNAQENIWEAPYFALFPGTMILLTVLCVNFIGDGLRDAFDPRSFER